MSKIKWSAPSNIAFVKYWGKKGNQIPINPSISGTLNSCRSVTSIEVESLNNQDFDIKFLFENRANPSFEKKVFDKFNKYYLKEIPELRGMSVRIESENTFPHSCGIASSASFYASLALCLTEFEGKFSIGSNDFFKRASYLARLGSGSACRSLFGPFVCWGDESFEYANLFEGAHSEFKSMADFICLISSEEKKVSSTIGHSLMENHPYKEERINQAFQNMQKISTALNNGDWDSFQQILEIEANQLHALMMCSEPGFFLLKDKSIELIQRLRDWRKQNNIKVAYTIDAGPNIHLLAHSNDKEKVLGFITKNLELLENGQFICDEISGAVRKESES